MFRHILVPLDGSIVAEAALPLAARLARRYQSDVTLLQVTHDGPRIAALGVRPSISTQTPPAIRSGHYLSELQRVAEFDGVRVSSFVPQLPGAQPSNERIAETIISEAIRLDADLVAMATHGQSGSDRWLLGGVAWRVLKRLPRNLLFIRPSASLPDLMSVPEDPARIVVPLDGSKAAERALVVGADIAARIGSEVVLLSVVPSQAVGRAGKVLPGNAAAVRSQRARSTEDYLAGIASALLARRIRCSWEVQSGRIAGRIQEMVEQQPSSLLVMATRTSPRSTHERLGSVAYELTRQARAPVLAVEPTEESGTVGSEGAAGAGG